MWEQGVCPAYRFRASPVNLDLLALPLYLTAPQPCLLDNAVVELKRVAFCQSGVAVASRSFSAMSLFTEVKRRNVFGVALFYLATSWLIAQGAETLLPNYR